MTRNELRSTVAITSVVLVLLAASVALAGSQPRRSRSAAISSKAQPFRQAAPRRARRARPPTSPANAISPRSALPDVLEGVARIGKEYGITIHNVFHAGDGNVHPIMLFDEDDPQQVQNTLRCSEEILEFCISKGGTITGEHGVGVEKLHLMDKMFNADTLDSFNRIKEVFDPQRRINDAKLIPSDRLVIELLKPAATNVPGGAL